MAENDLVARNRRMLIIGGVVVLLGIIVAGGYWYTRSPEKAAAKPATLQVAIDGAALVLGPATAPHKVVIDQTKVNGQIRDFDQETRGFLHADAAAGIVQVRYELAQAPMGDGIAALAKHDAALDQMGPPFPLVDWSPSVSLDGRPLTASTTLALADALETALAR